MTDRRKMIVVTHAATSAETNLIEEAIHSLRPNQRVDTTVPDGSGRPPEIYLIASKRASTLVPLTRFGEELLQALPPFEEGEAHILIATKRTM